MPKEFTPDGVRALIAERYETAAGRAADPAKYAGPLDLATLDLTDASGRALLLDEVAPGTLAQIAGYADTDVAAVPEGALRGSFACATPVSFADLQPGQTVLDLGCGQGMDVILAARAVGHTGYAIGVDLTPAQLDRAREHVAEAGLTNADVREGTMEAVPVETGTVDWVISNGAINYSPEKSKVFTEARRVLRTGGHLVVADVMVEDLDPILSHRLFGYVPGPGGPVSESEYLRLIQDAGFANAEVVSRTEFTARQMLQIVGYEDAPEDDPASPLQQMFRLLEGKIAASVIRARNPG